MANHKYIDIDLSDENGAFITEPIALFFQEIALSIRLAPGDIWGIYETVDISRYLFNQYITKQQIKNELQTFIAKNCMQAKNFEYNISVEFLKVENKELIYITFNVFDDNGIEHARNFLLGE